jgi:hypothetical protein
LRAIRVAHHVFGRKRLAGFVPVLNRCWGRPRRVRLELVPRPQPAGLEGCFLGIDAAGCVLLQADGGRQIVVPEHHIVRLTEVRPEEIRPGPAA